MIIATSTVREKKVEDALPSFFEKAKEALLKNQAKIGLLLIKQD